MSSAVPSCKDEMVGCGSMVIISFYFYSFWYDQTPPNQNQAEDMENVMISWWMNAYFDFHKNFMTLWKRPNWLKKLFFIRHLFWNWEINCKWWFQSQRLDFLINHKPIWSFRWSIGRSPIMPMMIDRISIHENVCSFLFSAKLVFHRTI